MVSPHTIRIAQSPFHTSSIPTVKGTISNKSCHRPVPWPKLFLLEVQAPESILYILILSDRGVSGTMVFTECGEVGVHTKKGVGD